MASSTVQMVIALAVSSLLAGCALATEPSGPDLPDARKGTPFPRIANCYGARLGHWTKGEELDVLAKFDLLIGGVNVGRTPEQRAKVAAMVAQLRKKNPRIIIIEFSSSAPYAHEGRAGGFPSDGWLLTPGGEKINGWPGTKMINLTRPAVVEWLAARSERAAKDPVLDGTFIDCMGGNFDRWACEIATGKDYQVDADGDGKADKRRELDIHWRKAKQTLGRMVREKIGPDPVFMANQAHQNNYDRLNGILLEDDLDYVLDDGRSWDRVLEHYFHWTQVPHRPCVTTIVSSSGIAPRFNPWKTMSRAERREILDRGRSLLKRMRFGLTTTLMGDGYFAYDLHTRWRGQHWWYGEYDAPLGYPKGPARRHGDGTWRREFDGGLVVVNPTFFDLGVKTATNSQDVSSDRVGREFIIPSQDGRILIRTGEKPRPGKLADPAPLMTPAGPERVVQRGDKVLWRGPDGAVAIFRRDGILLNLWLDGKAIVRNVRVLLTSGASWRDFKYAQPSFTLNADGTGVFTGRRLEKGKAIDYRLEVTWAGPALRLSYDFTAATDVHLHAFRHQAELPAALFAGGKVSADDGKSIALPGEKPRRGALRREAKELTVTSSDGRRRVRFTTSGALGLQDERVYRMDAFLLTQAAAGGSVKAGTKWQLDLVIEVKGRGD